MQRFAIRCEAQQDEWAGCIALTILCRGLLLDVKRSKMNGLVVLHSQFSVTYFLTNPAVRIIGTHCLL